MYCPNCGTEIITQKQKFCINCGGSLAEFTSEVQPELYDEEQAYPYELEDEDESGEDEPYSTESDSMTGSSSRVIAIVLVLLIGLAMILPMAFVGSDSCTSSSPSSCSQRTFICDLCGEEKTGKKHQLDIFGEECTVCKECYKSMKEIGNALDQLLS